MKTITRILNAPNQHWVGDGFPVRSLFTYQNFGEDLSPFLMLDHAGPMHFESSERARGVGEHPHRGFETVTIVYHGEVAHRDSTGAGGTIRPGDVQWMTAGSGIMHDEFHSPEFTRSGGMLEMVQLWVNLPARDKFAEPRYQTLLNENIPVVQLDHDAGSLRVISGEYKGVQGAANTFTPMDVWDVQLNPGHETGFTLPRNRTLAVVVLHGTVRVNGIETVAEGQVAVLDRENREFSLESTSDAKILVLSGEPIDEPIVGYGPFVMNDKAGIEQAIQDFNAGRFGNISPVEADADMAARGVATTK